MPEKSKLKRQLDLLMLSQSVIKLALMLVLIVPLLTGCAATSETPAASCPKPPALPASLTESASPAVSDYSQRVQNFSTEVSAWLERVRSYLQDSRQTKTQ